MVLRQTISRTIRSFWIIPLAASAVAGCTDGPRLSQVSGRVTLDGKPLANSTVMFLPDAGGRPAIAVTDADGRYELQFDNLQKGALQGRHEVKISTHRAESQVYGEDDQLIVTPEIPETLPRRYNSRSELNAEVMPGASVCNFDLQSE